MVWCVLLGILAGAPAAGQALADREAVFLADDARDAARKGDVARAYLLYSQAAALNPKDNRAWTQALALRRRALLETNFKPEGAAAAAEELDPLDASDLAEARKLRPPLRLEPNASRHTIGLKGDSKTIVEQVLKKYGVDVIFDGDYQPEPGRRFAIEDASWTDMIRPLEAALGVFLVPASERIALVAKDTPQKRQELEHTMAIAISLPTTSTLQEAQELGRMVQQLMEIQKFGIDSGSRTVVFRDRAAKVVPAAALFEQVLRHRAEVMLEVEFIEATANHSLDLGIQWQTQFPLAWLSRTRSVIPTAPAGGILGTIGGGLSLFGLGIAGSQLFATVSDGTARSLRNAQMRTVEGQAVSFHIGDKYPILTAGYFGAPAGAQGETFTPPPTFNFEDLGVVLKITPRVPARDEVSMDIEAEYKVLTGQALNGIPVIANRKFTSTVRLKAGEAAVVAGLLRTSEARTLTGIAGLGEVPVLGALFRQNSRSRESGQALITIRPHVLQEPVHGVVGERIHTGTETKPRIPL